MNRIYEAFDHAAEAAMLADVSIEVPWALIERFSTLVRESGCAAVTGWSMRWVKRGDW